MEACRKSSASLIYKNNTCVSGKAYSEQSFITLDDSIKVDLKKNNKEIHTMRNLTVSRAKSFVGILAKTKLYVEDHASEEIVINGTPCRKLGELKNGEQATKVFVIADTLSRNFCNDCYQLPDGAEDVALSGKNRYNLGSGNAFRFDNNDSEESQARRKKGNRTGWLILAAALLIGVVIGLLPHLGLFNKSPDAKTFTAEQMSITLTEDFQKSEIEGFTVSYTSEKVAVFALKNPFSLIEDFEAYTPQQYADAALQANGLTAAETKTADGLTYFEYERPIDDDNGLYHFFAYVYKADDAFWLIQFATPAKGANELAPQITEWAKSVTVSE